MTQSAGTGVVHVVTTRAAPRPRRRMCVRCEQKRLLQGLCRLFPTPLDACLLISDIVEVGTAADVRESVQREMLELITRILRKESVGDADSRTLCRHIALMLTRYFGLRGTHDHSVEEPASVTRLRYIIYENIEWLIS